MYGDPGWTLDNLPVVIFLVLMVLLGKSLLITLITVVLRFRWSHGLATGLTISQIGEFSFVLAGVAVSAGILDLTQFRLLISVTIVTIIGTPYLITLGGAIHHKASHKIALRMKKPEKGVPLEPETATAIEKAIVIIGFGPAGQRIAESLLDAYKERLFIIDINPKNLEQAKTYGLRYQVGDASYSELLEHLPLRSTQVVVVTVPDQISASRIIHTCKATLPGTLVVSRCRHHIYSGFLYMAGADKVIDEEDQIGQAIASECLKMLGAQ
ncbi:MAG: NAD-binding protein, partial [Phycisphaerae bacterium]|nr:NAD-binding protein [Phycisphaerae bacterium]